jgi:hypothetical protein
MREGGHGAFDCEASGSVPVKTSLGRRFLEALWRHFRGIRLPRNTAWPELLALKIVLRERRFDAIGFDRPADARVV